MQTWRLFAAPEIRLSPEEAITLAAYTGAAYRAINSYLREGGSAEPILEQRIGHLDRVLANNPTPVSLVVYRGVGEAFAAELVARGLAVGDIIQDKGFLSTSRLQDVAATFMHDSDGMLLAIRIPAESKALDIAALSAYPGEAEVLLARDARLRVVGYDAVADILELELLGDG